MLLLTYKFLPPDRYTGEPRKTAKSNDVSEMGSLIEKYFNFFFLLFKGSIKNQHSENGWKSERRLMYPRSLKFYAKC